MNEEAEQFERRLKRLPLRHVPPEWRADILTASISCPSSPAGNRSLLSTLNSQLSTLLWPHPAAWAGLAAIWIFIFAVNLSISDRAPAVVESSSAPPVEVIMAVRQQHRLLAELLGLRETRDADRQKIVQPRPRSERAEMLSA